MIHKPNALRFWVGKCASLLLTWTLFACLSSFGLGSLFL
uniref:Uncharacterized protein n=1 Tax=Rhizophora mucronata TaxID=61149 RepID=A0A2P2QLW6_RHIMU